MKLMKRISKLTLSAAFAAALISSPTVSQAAENEAAAFPGLKTLAADQADTSGKVSYDASLATPLNKVLDKENGVVRLLSTTLSKDAKARYFVDFDPGPSADPVFIFTDEKTNEVVGRIGADSVFIPGNGFVYALGRSNNMHLERQKFEVKGGALEEVKQPFSYVGLETKAKVPLKLTAQKDGGETIANIPKGDSLQVVIRDGEHLLVRTNFGLVGWWKMKTDVLHGNEEIEGIYYAGD